MKGSKVSKLILDGHGSYLGMEKGCFIVKDKYENVERYPLFENEIGEVILRSGNAVSTGALASLGFWGVDVLVLTQRGRPVAMMKSFDDDSHVKTRLCQYEAYNSEKGVYIAKQIVFLKMKGQNLVLGKYGFSPHDPRIADSIERVNLELDKARKKLTGIEGKFTERYFKHLFGLIPEKVRPEKRKKFKAYDGLNNIFNLAYEMLSWKVHRALVKAKLEPYLGFLHSVQYGKPSLVCDFQEMYRYLVDDFLIQNCQNLRKKDFTTKTESVTRKRKGRREYLNDSQTRHLMKRLDAFFAGIVEVPRMKVGQRQTIETLINEESSVLAKYMRDERETWIPRVAFFQSTIRS
jgi:CRISPR-associated protein Cas1